MTTFYSRLNYSFGNEDPNTEHQALQIQPTDRVVCITASGDRPLHLLLKECKEVVAIDINEIQNHLLKLKVAALQNLEHEEYLEFLGAVSYAGTNRRQYFAKVAKNLSQDSFLFWNQNQAMISHGVLYQGAMEKLVNKASYFFRFLRGRTISRLFEINDIHEQRLFVQSHWNVGWWSGLFNILLHPKISRVFLKDPGLNDHVGPSIHPGRYIYQRIENNLNRFLAKESILFSLVFRGRVEREAFPPYLKKEGCHTIKQRLDRLTITTKDLITYLEESEESSFDCFSLSDVASYLKETDFKRLLKAVYRTAKPGARFCLRQFLSIHQFPKELEPFFQRNHQLEEQLEQEDSCFVYRYAVGNVLK